MRPPTVVGAIWLFRFAALAYLADAVALVRWGPDFQDKIIQLVTAAGDDPARADYGAPAYPEAYPYIAAASAVAVALIALGIARVIRTRTSWSRRTAVIFTAVLVLIGLYSLNRSGTLAPSGIGTVEVYSLHGHFRETLPALYPAAYQHISLVLAAAALAMMTIGTALVLTRSSRADQRLGSAPRPVLPVE
jgi:hypothetical protein